MIGRLRIWASANICSCSKLAPTMQEINHLQKEINKSLNFDFNFPKIDNSLITVKPISVQAKTTVQLYTKCTCIVLV